MFIAIYYRLDLKDDWQYYTGISAPLDREFATARAYSILGTFQSRYPGAQVAILAVKSPTEASTRVAGLLLNPLPGKDAGPRLRTKVLREEQNDGK